MHSLEHYWEHSENPIESRAVTRIKVEKLFGQYDYDLRSPSLTRDLSRLFILYGENGSGKTRLLQAVYHLLSPAQNRGHRKRIAELVFLGLSVELSDGTALNLSRNSPSAGDYFLACYAPTLQLTFEGSYIFEKKDFDSESVSESFKYFLKNLDIQLYMLSADRSFTSDRLPRDTDERLVLRDRFGRITRRIDQDLEEDENSPLKHAMHTVTEHFRRRSVRATATGGLNVNTIYTEVIRNISTVGLQQDAGQTSLQSLRSRLGLLSERSRVFSSYKMIAPFRSDALDGMLASISTDKASLVSDVLSPYLDSIEAQLDALQSTQQLISTLLKTVNSFLIGKKLRFSVPEGLYIRSNNGLLQASALSSGEKHLLLIFCYTVIARDKRTIFLIDEPEISLNVKWQAKFLSRIMELAGDSPMQFVLATHSIELLSEYIEHVVRLPAYRDEVDEG